MTELVTPQSLSARKSFRGGVQTAWDSTSLGTLETCPRKYQLGILEGWVPSGDRVHLTFGDGFHKGVEFLDHRRVSKEELDDQDLILTLRHAMGAVALRADDGSFAGPWASDHTSKNLESLVRSLVWYFDHYRGDAFRVTRLENGKAAVELSFRFALPFDLGGEALLYCGHLDAIGEFAGQYYFLDRKTTGSSLSSRFFEGFSPNTQMSGYTWASKTGFAVPALGGIIDAMQVGAGFSRFGRQFVTRTDEQLEEWMVGAEIKIKQHLQFHDAGHFPQNPSACGNYGGCEFLPVCGKTPGVRQRFLESLFVRRSWDPLVPR